MLKKTLLVIALVLSIVVPAGVAIAAHGDPNGHVDTALGYLEQAQAELEAAKLDALPPVTTTETQTQTATVTESHTATVTATETQTGTVTETATETVTETGTVTQTVTVTPPPPAPEVLFGVTQTGLAAQEAAIGFEFEAVRVFKQQQSPPFADVDAYLAEGRYVYLSTKSTDMAVISAIAEEYEGQNLSLTVFHEPEDNMSASAFVALQRDAEEAIAGRVPFGPILMSWTFDERSGRDHREWVATDIDYDFLGADIYMRQYPYAEQGFAGLFEEIDAFAEELGLPIVVGEIASVSRLDSTYFPQDEQAATVDGLDAYLATQDNIEAVLWWESSVTKDGQFRDYRIADRPLVLEEWRQVVT